MFFFILRARVLRKGYVEVGDTRGGEFGSPGAVMLYFSSAESALYVNRGRPIYIFISAETQTIQVMERLLCAHAPKECNALIHTLTN